MLQATNYFGKQQAPLLQGLESVGNFPFGQAPNEDKSVHVLLPSHLGTENGRQKVFEMESKIYQKRKLICIMNYPIN